MTSCFGTPVYLTGHEMHHGKRIFWMAETGEDILTGHKAKLSRPRTRQKEKPHSVFP